MFRWSLKFEFLLVFIFGNYWKVKKIQQKAVFVQKSKCFSYVS